ncbi:hypothetical protein [Rhodocyclus tenuis]|uniref:Uncharacterized protein n=1 Tax=Rhodocyclus tenuis TaxID=1066 RepID=A0A840GEG6_RHOTE|nr:hypothetical protein [Rhodocyclus tenuis]MBB4249028.1 hypothetical protein [Rhodocyclus tenuis]
MHNSEFEGRAAAANTLAAILSAHSSSGEGLVTGPGTATSDDVSAEARPGIFVLNAETVRVLGADRLSALVEKVRALRTPVWLSAGEYVLAPDVVAALGAGVLHSWNRAGLDLREGGADPQAIEAQMLEALACTEQRVANWQPEVVRLALGGNLGIALGAGVQEFKAQQQLARQNEQFDMDKQQFGWQAQDRQRETDKLDHVKKFWHDVGPVFGADLKTQAEYLRRKYAANDKVAGYDDGHDVEVEHLPDGNVAYTQKLADGKGGFTYGEKTIATPQQVASELLRYAHVGLAAIDPKYGDNFLAHLQKMQSEDRAAALKERELKIQADHYQRSDDTTAKHYAAWADIMSDKAVAGRAGAAGGKATTGTGMPAEIAAVYNHYGYKDPTDFTSDIRKRVAADNANAGMGGVDIQALATKTQQNTAALMQGQIGAGHTVEELYPVALRMAQAELGVQQLGPDGKPVQDKSGAYLPYPELAKNGQWYTYVRDGQGNQLVLGARPVDPTRFGLAPEKVASIEVSNPAIRGAVKEAFDLSAKGDESGIAEMSRRIGERKTVSLLNAYQRSLQKPAAPTTAPATIPALRPATSSAAQPATPIEGHVLRSVSAGKDGPEFSVIDPATGQIKKVTLNSGGRGRGLGLNREAIQRWTQQQ